MAKVATSFNSVFSQASGEEFGGGTTADVVSGKIIHKQATAQNAVWKKIAYLPTDLGIYKKIQRPFDNKHAFTLYMKRNEKAVQSLKVCLLPGSKDIYVIIDGQHTFWFLCKLGFTSVPCIVYDLHSVKEISELAYIWNGGQYADKSQSKKPMSVRDQFSIGYHAGENGRLSQAAILKVVEKTCNMALNVKESTNASSWYIRALGGVQSVYAYFGAKNGLVRTLSLLRAIFSDEDGDPMCDALKYEVIMGVGKWQNQYRTGDSELSVAELSVPVCEAGVTPARLIEEARNRLFNAGKSSNSRYNQIGAIPEILDDALGGVRWQKATPPNKKKK